VPARVAEQFDCALMTTLVGLQETEIEVTAEGPTTVSVVEADLPKFCADWAVMVAVPELGAFAGAVYKPVEEIVPAVAFQSTVGS